MSFTTDCTEKVPVQLEDGTIVYMEIAQGGGREDVSFDLKAQAFAPVARSIEAIVKAVATPIKNARPDKASVKFGLEIGIEQGSLVAAIVRGTGTANLEITLAWEREKRSQEQSSKS